ncbi:MAG: hypothetical protein ACT4PX_06770 [Actinomycetota bacterium]
MAARARSLGSLAGYCGATRRSHATDLRNADRCVERRLDLFGAAKPGRTQAPAN